ncbi:MAG TPA: lysylphosphatidylglycerol synthase transmembrane domain-containing protein [Terriglobales bacterium]|nr:lysylphosphatidylglycerol synthase transmembrane domain-containing protein [Terriglobales bacterium]
MVTVDPIADKPRSIWSSPWLKIALSLGVVALLVNEVNFAELRRILRRADPWWAGLGLLTLLASQVVCVTRWRMLAKPLGLQGSYGAFFGAYFTGLFFNLFGPSTVAGDIARTLFLAGTEQRRSLALVSVLAERGIGLITLVWIATIALVLQPQLPLPWFIRYGALTVAPLTILAWFWLPQLAVTLFPHSERLQRFVTVDLLPYRRDWRLLLRANLASLAFHLLNIGSQVPLVKALGLDVSFGYVFLFVPIVNLVSMVPISFNGIGIREAGYWYFLSRVGVHKSSAVALGILSSATVLITGLFGGLVYLIWQHRKKANGRSEAQS